MADGHDPMGHRWSFPTSYVSDSSEDGSDHAESNPMVDDMGAERWEAGGGRLLQVCLADEICRAHWDSLEDVVTEEMHDGSMVDTMDAISALTKDGWKGDPRNSCPSKQIRWEREAIRAYLVDGSADSGGEEGFGCSATNRRPGMSVLLAVCWAYAVVEDSVPDEMVNTFGGPFPSFELNLTEELGLLIQIAGQCCLDFLTERNRGTRMFIGLFETCRDIDHVADGAVLQHFGAAQVAGDGVSSVQAGSSRDFVNPVVLPIAGQLGLFPMLVEFFQSLAHFYGAFHRLGFVTF